MSWHVYTKRLISKRGVCLLWFWRRELPHGRIESPVGFSTRAACEADAIKHGCRAEEQQQHEPSFSIWLSAAAEAQSEQRDSDPTGRD
jgi:hypothetical protein